FSTDIKVLIVPQHLDPGAETRPGPGIAFDVDEKVGPRHLLPGRVIEPAINLDGTAGPITDVALRRNKGRFLFRGLCPGLVSRYRPRQGWHDTDQHAKRHGRR